MKRFMRGLWSNGRNKPTRLYGVWCYMRERCGNPNTKRYKDYGGRGISVCSEWDDYAVFRAWALANGYKKGLTLDRENNDSNYEPDNCQWITNAEQAKNRRHPGGQKLTEQDVIAIRASDQPATHEAKKHGVSKWTIFDVRSRRRWAHV